MIDSESAEGNTGNINQRGRRRDLSKDSILIPQEERE